MAAFKRGSPLLKRRVAPGRRLPRGASSTCASASAATRWMIIGAFVLLAVLAVVLAYRAIVARPVVAAERFTASAKPPPAKLVFLHMDGCGWCDRFKPQWAEFEAKYGPGLAAGGVTILSIERKDPRAASFGPVDGYPTVLFVTEGDDGKRVRFEGERTPEGLIAFVREQGYTVREGYVDGGDGEPQTEFGRVHSTVATTKGKQDGKFDGQQSTMQNGAGGNLKK